MTKNEIIYQIKSHLKEGSDDTSIWTSDFIWDSFIIAKSKRIEQTLKNRKTVPQHLYTTVCVSLTDGLSHECGCITVGCPVKKTVELPKYLASNLSDSLEVFTLGGKKINRSTEEDINSIDIYNEFKSSAYILVNNKLVVFNNPKLKLIQIKALWEDETLLDDIKHCKDSTTGTTTPCPEYDNIAVSGALFFDILKLMKEMFNMPLQLQEDITNNTNPEI